MATDFVASRFDARISTPRLFRSVIEARYPLRDNSAATKYSPATPQRTVSSFIRASGTSLRQHRRQVGLVEDADQLRHLALQRDGETEDGEEVRELDPQLH